MVMAIVDEEFAKAGRDYESIRRVMDAGSEKGTQLLLAPSPGGRANDESARKALFLYTSPASELVNPG